MIVSTAATFFCAIFIINSTAVSSPTQFQTLEKRAKAFQESGKSEQAEKVYRRLLELTLEQNGELSPQTATILHNLAQSLHTQRKLQEAESLYRRALAIKRKGSKRGLAITLSNLGALLSEMDRRIEAESLKREALSIAERNFDRNDPELAPILNNWGTELIAKNQWLEAERIFRRALEIHERVFGRDHFRLVANLGNLASVLLRRGQMEEAERLYRRAISITETQHGVDSAELLPSLFGLSNALRSSGEPGEAELVARRAITIAKHKLHPDDPLLGTALNELGVFLNSQQVGETFANDYLVEISALFRRALDAYGESVGKDHSSYAKTMENLALVLLKLKRVNESEKLIRHSLSIMEKIYGRSNEHIAETLHNLAVVLRAQGKSESALNAVRRSIYILKNHKGDTAYGLSSSLNLMAHLLRDVGRADEADHIYRTALSVAEYNLGKIHPNLTFILDSYASLKQQQKRWNDAIDLYSRARSIFRQTDYKIGVQNYTGTYRGYIRALFQSAPNSDKHLDEAFEAAQWLLDNQVSQALASLGERFARGGGSLAQMIREQQDLRSARKAAYRRLNRALSEVSKRSADTAQSEIAHIEKSLRVIRLGIEREFGQYSRLTEPVPLTVRETKAALNKNEVLVLFIDIPRLGDIAGETVVFAITKTERRWVRVPLGTRELREYVTKLRCGLDSGMWTFWKDIRERCKALLKRESSDQQLPPFDVALAHQLYQDLFHPIEDLIKGKELLIVPSGALTQLPFEVLVTSLPDTKEKYGWQTKTIGLFGASFTKWKPNARQGRQLRDPTGVEIVQIMPGGPADNAGLNSGDVVLSIDGNDTSFSNFAETVRNYITGADSTLQVFRSGKLRNMRITFGTREVTEWIPRFFDEIEPDAVNWLVQQQAITVLPSVSSLKSLEEAGMSPAPRPFVGFGNPLLIGLDGRDRRAFNKQTCPDEAEMRLASAASRKPVRPLFRGDSVDVESLRRQAPLPESADEVCAVAQALGTPRSSLDKAVQLGRNATERKIKAMSKSGDLSKAKVVHFATHGLVAGETALFAENMTEPSLLMTPPSRPVSCDEYAANVNASAKNCYDDNGLLTASEVAHLKLNADWVILSACNTASADGGSAEALSGLARAFFYAGARSLLVSHWYVDSEAAVLITTGAVNALKAEPGMSKAEALRRSIGDVIAKGGRFTHPSVWGPFVLVGGRK